MNVFKVLPDLYYLKNLIESEQTSFLAFAGTSEESRGALSIN